MTQCQQWLQQAVEHAGSDRQRQRAQHLLADYEQRLAAIHPHRQYYHALDIGAAENRWSEAADLIQQALEQMQHETLRPTPRHQSHLVRVQVDLAQALENAQQYSHAIDAYQTAAQMPRNRPWIERITKSIARCEQHLEPSQSSAD